MSTAVFLVGISFYIYNIMYYLNAFMFYMLFYYSGNRLTISCPVLRLSTTIMNGQRRGKSSTFSLKKSLDYPISGKKWPKRQHLASLLQAVIRRSS